MDTFNEYLQHSLRVEVANKADPDDANSWLCGACNLPIFSTPFKTVSSIHLHDQCAQLPAKLEDHALHPGYPLFLKEVENPAAAAPCCSNCYRQCGGMYYHCPNIYCRVLLDVLCAREISIMHRSHKHRMINIMLRTHQHRMMAMWRFRSAPTLRTLVCDACGTQHADGNEDPSYLCKVCGFWIHPKCASLPNAVLLGNHPHSLFLNYHDDDDDDFLVVYLCAICGGKEQGWGYFFCPKCSYHVHIRCAMSHPTVEPVLIRNVKNSELLRLPMPDEQVSLTRYILENSTSNSTSRDEGKLPGAGAGELHQHPLIFHEEEEEGGPHQCNACVQTISPPFYTCSHCPHFYLHDSCLNLPRKIKHPAHEEHVLILLPEKSNLGSHIGFRCHGCERVCNGFVYFCKTCDITLDVICAFMPAAITHESHGKTHILYISSASFSFIDCKCCYKEMRGIWYECRSCRDFKIHAKCALLPSNVTHKFDEHPLTLTTNTRQHQICEICEQEDMDQRRWRYNCDKCDHSFHINCIPCVDRFSRVKLGVSVSVQGHECPLKLIRSTTVYGYRCGHCNETFRPDGFENSDDDSEDFADDSEDFSYECFKCYFRVHSKCAGKEIPTFRPRPPY